MTDLMELTLKCEYFKCAFTGLNLNAIVEFWEEHDKEMKPNFFYFAEQSMGELQKQLKNEWNANRPLQIRTEELFVS